MHAGTFVQSLFAFEPPPGTIPLRAPVAVHAAMLEFDGRVTCLGETLPDIAALPLLCRRLIDAGEQDAALQLRTRRGEAVCFVGSICGLAQTDDNGAAEVQLDLGLSA